MRAARLLAALVFVPALIPVAARAADPAPPAPAAVVAPAASPAAPADPRAAEIEALRQRLLSAQQTIATLERQLATTKDRAVLADQCRVKNGRLVFIARELIEAYEKRYAQEHHDPLQTGRRRFEFELQALSDAVYDNRAEVPVRVPTDKPAPATPARAKPAGQ
jgi:hypothetical protein